MNERAAPSIDIGTNLGKTIMVQVLSAILIIGGTLFFGPPGTDILWLTIVGILYMIGFIQMLLTRYLLQREKNGILAAIIVSLLAMAFSVIAAIIWGVLLDRWIPSFFYVIIFAINLANGAVLNKERSLMSS